MVALLESPNLALIITTIAGVRFAGIDGLILLASLIVGVCVWRSERRTRPAEVIVPAAPATTWDTEPLRTRSQFRPLGARSLPIAAIPRPTIAAAILAVGLLITEVGLRRLASNEALSLGLVVTLLGLGAVVWLDLLASRSAGRTPDGVQDLGGRPTDEPARTFWQTVLPRASGAQRWLLIGIPAASTFAVWRMMRVRPNSESHTDIALIWVIAILSSLIAVAWPIGRPNLAVALRRPPAVRAGLLIFAGVTLLAAILRLWRPADYPWAFSGDEGNFALSARSVLGGELKNPFGTGFWSHPNLFFYMQAVSLWAFGDDVGGARLLSGLLGVIAVIATMVYARHMFGRFQAVIAGVLLATFHHHVFLSRTALNNIGDTLSLPLSLWLVDRGIVGRRRLESLLTGFVLGAAQYFYFGARLLPFIVAAVIGVGVLHNSDASPPAIATRLQELAPYLVLMLTGAVVVITPYLVYYLRFTDEANGRLHQVSMFSSGWLTREEARTGSSAVSIIATRFGRALLLPFHGDVSGFYRPAAPFVGAPLALPVALGMSIVAARFWQRRYSGLAISFVACAAALSLTEGERFQSNRFSGGVVLLPLFGAVGLGALVRIVVRLVRVPQIIAVATTAVAIGSIGAWNFNYFFHDANQVDLYSDPNTQIANTLAYELKELSPGVTVYFAGPPRMWYDGFKNIAFIAPEAEGISVEQPWTALTPKPAITGPTLFVFLPERASELPIVRGWFPQGTTRLVTDSNDTELYLEYRVDP